MDVLKVTKFEQEVDRLQSHPMESVRKAAAEAKRLLYSAGLDAAKEVLKDLPALREKGLLDTLMGAGKNLGSAAAVARLIRAGQVYVNEKVETIPTKHTPVGSFIEVWGPGAGEARKKLHEYRVP